MAVPVSPYFGHHIARLDNEKAFDQDVLRIPANFKKGKRGIVLEGVGANASDTFRVSEPTLIKNSAPA